MDLLCSTSHYLKIQTIENTCSSTGWAFLHYRSDLILAGQLNSKWAGGHGGGEETAAMLAVDPSLVHFQCLSEQKLVNDISEMFPTMGFDRIEFQGIGIPVPRLVDRYTSNGWIGPDHPKDASEKWGQEMLTRVADYIGEFVDVFRKIEVE